MNKMMSLIFIMLVSLAANASVIQAATKRIPQFANDKVKVWETIIYPATEQLLKMHRHDHNRILVALNDGILKITNDKGQTHLLKLTREKAYYLPPDVPGEWHTDVNIGRTALKVLVIELN